VQVLLVPYSPILVTKKEFNTDTGMMEISATVLEDSYKEKLDLPTVPA
jgi:hypothetical protein